jgi:hypothetical protein
VAARISEGDQVARWMILNVRTTQQHSSLPDRVYACFDEADIEGSHRILLLGFLDGDGQSEIGRPEAYA